MTPCYAKPSSHRAPPPPQSKSYTCPELDYRGKQDRRTVERELEKKRNKEALKAVSDDRFTL